MLRVDEGADLGLGIVGVADDDVLRAGGVLFAEFVVDGALHQDAGAGGAAFPVEGEDTEQGRIDRGVQVGVGEHDARGLAAELHGQALEVGGGVAEDRLARWWSRPVKEISGHVRVLDQGVAGFLAEAVDQVEHAVGQAGVLEDLRPRGRRRAA